MLANNKSVTIEELEEPQRARTTTSNQAAVRETILHRIKPFHGVFTQEPLWELIIRPFFVLLNPIVLWSIVIISFTTVWFIITNFVLAQAFLGPPYLLTTAELGYVVRTRCSF